jgi:transposase
MGEVVIGVDPHKRSNTIEVLDPDAVVLAAGRFGADREGYRSMLALGRRYASRRWAVEGCNGVGKHLAQRLVADGESVVDVPAKLAARVRVFSTGNGRKTDPVDAHSVALAALRADLLNEVRGDDALVALKLLADRRDELVRARTQAVNRLHRLLTELVAGGAKRDLSATQARALLATVRPRDTVGRTRRALAVEQLGEVTAADRKLKALEKRIVDAVSETGTGLTELFGVGSVGAARILGDVGQVARFPTKAHFASWTGTAPIDASSGDQIRHRLSRAGNRRLNHVLHIMAVVQIRYDTEGRAYYLRKRAAGKTSLEALRCLKRRLSDVVYHQLVLDQRAREAGPGGQTGATTKSSATGPTPTASSSERSLPGPAENHATTDPALAS